MRLSKLFALLVSGTVGVAALSAVGCGNSNSTTGAGGSTGGTATGGTGGAGGAACNFDCCPTCKQVEGVGSQCVGIVDNSKEQKFGLRMAELVINKPTALSATGPNSFIANLISSAVQVNLAECNLPGKGTFSWLLEFDLAANKLKTGGSNPVTDPTAGFCFVNKTFDTSKVAPITVDVTVGADGTFSVAKGADVIVPIFLTDPNKPVLLPLSNARIINATLTSDHDCIGKYNADKLKADAECKASGDVTAFTTGATLDAYITLEAADTVPITDLKKSMCALLTGEDDGDMTFKKCKRDAGGKITSKGDWCSTTDKAADAMCADAFKLGADFAASSVKVTGDCQ